MKSLTVLATSLALSLALAGTARADDKAVAKKEVAGHWEGPLKVTPAVELRITLDVTKGKDGSLSAKWGSPDQGQNELPLDSFAFEDGTLTFSANKLGASYKGKLSESGTEVVGEFTQAGNSFPLTLKRSDASKAVAMAIPKELEGLWEGKLSTGAGIELRLVLKVEKGKDGALKAVLASPDQGANNIPISSIDLKDDELTFESKGIFAKYSGKKNEKGTAFEGHFEQGGAKLPLTLRKTDKISQLPRPQLPKPPFPYRAEDVSYENEAGRVKLAGTLTLPPGKGPFPAVILITGSGAQDRDESILGHKPFLVLADYLTRRGVAVLRVDDRGVGGSTGSIKTSTSEDFAGDVLAGIQFLKGRKEIDTTKVGLIGHSEGGIIAPITAARSKDVAFIVLMAGTGLPGTEILEAQGQLILKAMGASKSMMKLQRDAQKRLVDIIAKEKDEKAAKAKLAAALKEIKAGIPEADKKAMGESAGGLSEAATEAFNNPWFRYFLTYDPRPTLRLVKCPVLALNGEKDLQVPSKQNLDEIAKALAAAGNRDVKTVEFAGLNHLFQPCKTGAPSEYSSIETTIAPEALKTMGDWIVAQTGANNVKVNKIRANQ
jgi:pimeloyl-ACP methyl ester carboxylesterase